MCDALKSLGEILPDLAEKLDNLKLETINEVDKPLYDGGARFFDPYHSRRALPTVTAAPDPTGAAVDLVDIATGIKDLTELAEQNNAPDDYAANCRKSFADAAWQAFKSRDGSYVEKAKAAKDSLKSCWKEAWQHIKDTVRDNMSFDSVIEYD